MHRMISSALSNQSLLPLVLLLLIIQAQIRKASTSALNATRLQYSRCKQLLPKSLTEALSSRGSEVATTLLKGFLGSSFVRG